MAKTNFKQLLLEKGEKIGLAVAAGIAILLVLTQLFWPGHGLSAPSPKVFKDPLDNLSKAVSEKMTNPANKPVEGSADLPDPKKDPNKGAKLESFTPQKIDRADLYTVSDLFATTTPLDSNRKQPAQYQPVEGRAIFTYAQVRSYILNKDATQIGVLEGAAGGTPGPGGVAGSSTTGRNDLGRAQGFYGTSGGRQGPGPGPGTTPAGIGRPGRGGLNLGDGGQQPPDTTGLGEATAQFRMVDVEKLNNQTNVRLADTIRPLRMVLLAASFPYRAQLDEFRAKLRLPSRAAVLAETALDSDPATNQYLPAFRFLGVKVKRLEVDAQGKQLPGKEWTELNLTNDYKPYVVLSGRRLEPDDPTLDAICFDRLVMPRLAQMREKQYPEIEKSLPTLAASLKALELKTAMPAPPSILNADDFDPFSRGTANNQTGMPGPGSGVGMPGPGPGPGPRPFPGPGPGRPGPGRPTGPGYGPGESGNLAEVQPPDHCLVRLVDVTVKPGKSYRYRIQVQMANPNYKRTDVASPRYADPKELPTNDAWFELPETVVVPPEMHYYAVDQKELDGKENYKGINAEARLEKYQTVIQIHRWLENVANSSRRFTPVGEWVVAERLIVGRGEFTGRTQTIEVPVWMETREAFIVPKKKEGTKEVYGLPVSFATTPQDAVVVDFTGGEVRYDLTEIKGDKPVTTLVKDTQRTEVLLWSADGKLLALKSAEDPESPENKERKERLDAYRARIKEVKGTTKAPGTGPFGGAP